MRDQYGREINYLRISITDRCNLRCFYCRAGEFKFIPHREILRYEEIIRLAKLFARLGFERARITGGEPLVRPDVLFLVRGLKQVKGIGDLVMTSNGTLLERYAEALKDAGLDRVNISLDSLNPENYRAITGGGELEMALRGIERAAPLFPIKLNTVISKRNLADIEGLIEYAAKLSAPLRFIELMPLSLSEEQWHEAFVSERELISRIERRWRLKDLGREGRSTSHDYLIEELGARIGFISSISDRFCETCNRMRLTSDGKIRPCLGDPLEIDIKGPLRRGASDEELLEIIKGAVYNKPAGHQFGLQPAGGRPMNQIGG